MDNRFPLWELMGQRLIYHAVRDEKTIERWMLDGMKGRLVRKKPLDPITIEPCPPGEDGQFTVFVYQEGL